MPLPSVATLQSFGCAVNGSPLVPLDAKTGTDTTSFGWALNGSPLYGVTQASPMPGQPLTSIGGIITAEASLGSDTALMNPADNNYLYWDTVTAGVIGSSIVPS